jgi:hypothetical protein
MKVLVACEFSGRVRNAFMAMSHDVLSCDFLPSEDNSPYHCQGDVRDLLADQKFDLMICHPPCTYLSVSGLHWNTRIPGRAEKTEEALAFVQMLLDASVPHIALENPVGCISTRICKPSQTVQPWQFGEDASKATCLWLKGLPLLTPTKLINPEYACPCGHRFEYELGKYGCPNCEGQHKARPIYANQTPGGQNKLGPSPDRWKERSRTYQGIANAMAEQWSDL